MKRLVFLLPISVFLFIGYVSVQTDLFATSEKAEKIDQVHPLPDFPYAEGWLGADDAYSIPLGGDRSLWLFGDTLVADHDAKLRSQYKVMVRNSVGISDCPSGGSCSIRYFWQKPYAPTTRSFFDTGTDDLWYWPLDAFLDGKRLFVSLLAVRNKPNAGMTDAFGFEIVGTKLATISNAIPNRHSAVDPHGAIS